MTIINKIKFRLKKLIKKEVVYNKSFSQCGEDLIIDYIFKLRGIKNPSYLDIGANDPFYLNNTAIFYLRGCKGINIDANPTLIEKFNKKRNTDININVGVGHKKSTLDFYIMADDTLSTFSEEEYTKMVAYGHKLNTIKKVDIFPLQEILDKHNNSNFPDLLSLDVEGFDFQILKSIDFSLENCPKIICVEAAEYSPIGAGDRRDELIELLTSNGYYEYANTNLNAILVHKKFWFI
jgi:FkbM family methyltransferase